MSRAGEFEWIARHLAPLAGETSFGLRDDAALLQVADGHELVVTQDAIAENIHFLSDDPVDAIARKALRVNVSDVLAKGATPFAYSLALGVPDLWDDHEIIRFCSGLERDQEEYGLRLNGGDTFRSPDRLIVSVTMFGTVKKDSYVSRLDAKPDDLVFVTGTIGDAALGLKVATGGLVVEAGKVEPFLSAYRIPTPPFGIQNVIAHHANASMDVSDGLLGDLEKLCKASGVSASVVQESVPLSDAVHEQVQRDPSLWRVVLGGGDDYQCLCTVPENKAEDFRAAAAKVSVNVTEIGKIGAENAPKVSLLRNGVAVSTEIESFSHF